MVPNGDRGQKKYLKNTCIGNIFNTANVYVGNEKRGSSIMTKMEGYPKLISDIPKLYETREEGLRRTRGVHGDNKLLIPLHYLLHKLHVK